MFDLVTVEDAVQIEPSDLGLPLPDAVSAVLRKNFIDKVVPEIGLVVALYDLQRVSGGTITQGQGSVQFEATFRLAVFRPFSGEILIARLCKSTPEGLYLTTGFFSDMFIPEENLQEGSEWDDKDGHWYWQTGEGDENRLWYDPDNVRLRVTKVVYRTPPTAVQLKAAYQNQTEGVPVVGSQESPFVPIEVVGTIREDGLGLVSWW